MSSGFISEVELEERRRLRQEEWEKVRKPDEPTGSLVYSLRGLYMLFTESVNVNFYFIEAPEEEHDNRTLFERLEEQRKKKEHEYEETHKLSMYFGKSISIAYFRDKPHSQKEPLNLRRKHDKRTGRRRHRILGLGRSNQNGRRETSEK